MVAICLGNQHQCSRTRGKRTTHLESSLTVIVHLELNHDALIEVQLSEFKWICWSDEVQLAETAEQVRNFIWGDDRAILALNEKETSKEISSDRLQKCERTNLR